MKMKAIVTGGSGFIGTNLIKRLLNLGHDVVSLDLEPPRIKQDGCNYVEGDVRNFGKVMGTWCNQNRFSANVIFHLAAVTKIQESFKIPMDTVSINGSGSNSICNFIIKGNGLPTGKKRGMKVVYASTSAIDGGHFLNPYVYGKWIGEQTFKLYKDLYNW